MNKLNTFSNIASKQKDNMYMELNAKLVIRLIVYLSTSEIYGVQPVPAAQRTPQPSDHIKRGSDIRVRG
jgi:hypothetical protein